MRFSHGFVVLVVVGYLVIATAAAETPFIAERPGHLTSSLDAALRQKGPGYLPRTRHLLPDGRPRYTNRLILEDSPYLIQHAHNPVDWYAWGEEAFERARRENKPVFVSIGYSTCHWCHVMEKESFEDPGIAGILNRHFIAIKVDRERRPDVDKPFATAALLINRHSGWPLSAFLTSQGKPFYTSTYQPREHFARTLKRVVELWNQENDKVRRAADRVADSVTALLSQQGNAKRVGEEAISAALMTMQSQYDDLQGGFGNESKFPRETWLMLLQDQVMRHGDSVTNEMLITTLDAMARGGIYDQVGGGFHRYTVDPGWETPHFEKMLYNQASLARVYTRAWRRLGTPHYRYIATGVLDYVLREMRNEEGAFFSATDADSPGGEGAYFVWTPEQVSAVLTPAEARLALQIFGVTPEGNFEGSTILHFNTSPEELAEQLKASQRELYARLNTIRAKLFTARLKRPAPQRDEKVLLGWNALMITALVEAGETLGVGRYGEAAKKAAETLWHSQRREDGGLWRVSLDGKVSIAALLEDYAFFAEALVALYDQTQDERWLNRARRVVEAMMERFWDADAGGFYVSPPSSTTPLFVRAKDGGDTALPSGNAVAVRVLAQLARRTGELEYLDDANRTISVFAERIDRTPILYASTLRALGEMTGGEIASRQYAAQGKVSAHAYLSDKNPETPSVTVTVRMAPGWHINAHQPLQEMLIATQLQLDDQDHQWSMASLEYPRPVKRKLGFQDEELALYEQSVKIQARLKRKNEHQGSPDVLIRLRLRLQACSDRVCLQPEWITLMPSLAGSSPVLPVAQGLQ